MKDDNLTAIAILFLIALGILAAVLIGPPAPPTAGALGHLQSALR